METIESLIKSELFSPRTHVIWSQNGEWSYGTIDDFAAAYIDGVYGYSPYPDNFHKVIDGKIARTYIDITTQTVSRVSVGFSIGQNVFKGTYYYSENL